MLETTLSYLNQQIELLGFATQVEALAELADGDKKYPSVYTANGNWVPLQLERGVIYHRITAPILTARSEVESPKASDPILEVTYPMRLVAALPRTLIGTESRYIPVQIAHRIKAAIWINNPIALRQSLDVERIQTDNFSEETDSELVWETELAGLDFQLPSELMLLAIDYTIQMTAPNSCLQVSAAISAPTP